MLPLESGISRCQHAFSSATGAPSSRRYMTRLRPAILRGSSSRLTSTSYAATYQQLRGQSASLKVSGARRMSPSPAPLPLAIALLLLRRWWLPAASPRCMQTTPGVGGGVGALTPGGRSGLAGVVVDAGLAPHHDVVAAVVGPDADLVAVGIDRHLRHVARRDDEHAHGLVAVVRQLVRPRRPAREAHEVAGLELLLAVGV